MSLFAILFSIAILQLSLLLAWGAWRSNRRITGYLLRFMESLLQKTGFRPSQEHLIEEYRRFSENPEIDLQNRRYYGPLFDLRPLTVLFAEFRSAAHKLDTIAAAVSAAAGNGSTFNPHGFADAFLRDSFHIVLTDGSLEYTIDVDAPEAAGSLFFHTPGQSVTGLFANGVLIGLTVE